MSCSCHRDWLSSYQTLPSFPASLLSACTWFLCSPPLPSPRLPPTWVSGSLAPTWVSGSLAPTWVSGSLDPRPVPFSVTRKLSLFFVHPKKSRAWERGYHSRTDSRPLYVQWESITELVLLNSHVCVRLMLWAFSPILSGVIQLWVVAVLYLALQLCLPALVYSALSYSPSLQSVLVS